MAHSSRARLASRYRLLLALGAVSSALSTASGCDYDERRLRVSRVAIDEAGGNGGVLDAAGASNDDAPMVGGDAGQTSLAGAANGGANAGAANAGLGGGSIAGASGSRAGSGGTANGSGGTSAGSGGSGGNTASGGGSGGSGGGGAGASSGSAGAHSVIIGPCGDIDDNQIDDCSETLVQNSRFDSNLDHWSAEAQVTSAWDAQNATAVTTSGSAKLINAIPVASAIGLTMAGAEQCLQISGGVAYQVAARVLIPVGQGEGQAGVNLWVFGGDDCKSDFLVALTPALSQTVGVWTTAQGAATLPAGAKSMIVRLVALKPFTQAQLQASFDDVLVSSN